MESKSSNLSRILYVSTASKTVTQSDLQDILESSRRNNEKNHITGVMCASYSHFVQILEGPESNLIRLYAKIIDDPRHYDCILIGISPIFARTFIEWSMGYIEKTDAEISFDRHDLLKYRERNDSDELIRIMRELISRLK
ncbi:MAG: BLUF domain-containing protein [Mycobacteriaceae bacterium]|nr:BLUF domain-containing protein [Mycobacteriaceae bacterium]